MVNVSDTSSSFSVRLPPVRLRIKSQHFETWAELEEERTEVAEFAIVSERGTKVHSARLRFDDRTIEVCFARSYSASGGEFELHAPDASVSGGMLDLGNSEWKAHPRIEDALELGYSQRVVQDWSGYPVLAQEEFDENQNVRRLGLRAPQVGALHALAAHWSVKSSHAKIVLPTGTGKTDVMIAASVMRRARRTLVIVPSDALRTQALTKFSTLGVLKKVGSMPSTAMTPVVSKLLRAPTEIQQIDGLRRANVVGTTTQMLLGMEEELLREFIAWFDLILFDEAHHLPAASWQRIHGKVDGHSAVVSVTATPYRNDGRRVPGELIYQFPLRLAQQQGYFRPISVARVEEYDPTKADQAIARKAIHALREDERRGSRHIIFARARSIEHADSLQALYAQLATDLNPAALHSRVGAGSRRAIVASLASLSCRVIVCVDMLGEGFDLPTLKIAALHDLHKSLPVTLQFIGRFTRSSVNVGDATAVINMAEPMAQTAVAELFSDDADWNDLIPELSAQAIKSEEDIAAFLDSMRDSSSPDSHKFDLGLLRPKTSVTIYKATSFNPARLLQALPKGSVVHQSWLNEDRDLLIFVAQDRVYPEWSASKEAASLEWNLVIVAYDPVRGLLYINSTYPMSRSSQLARAIGGETSILINGERMFRVFDGIHRAVLHNVGLYKRGGALRFQMLAGMDIGEFVTSAVQAGSSKSNLFALGYEDGRKTNIGASAKGRVWSMTPTSIPDWLAWSKRVAEKLVDDTIQTDTFMRYALIPTEVLQRPEIDVFTCVPPDELIPSDFHGERKISASGMPSGYTQVDMSFEVNAARDGSVSLRIFLPGVESIFELQWAGDFQVRQVDGPRLRILDGGEEISLEDFLTSNPPVLLLVDGSELVGKYHFRLPSSHPYTFHPDSILGLDWGGTPITRESKWKNGRMRPSSVQGFMIEKCLEGPGTVVFDDDDTGEVADIIVIEDRKDQREIEVTLFHCKFSGGVEPGARFKDLYEVCGQAVKSARMMNRADGLLAHMLSREQRRGGRTSRFERGGLDDLRSLQRRVGHYRMRLNIGVVQPGLSASALTPELSSILAAADGFVLEFTGRRLKVLGSA